MQDGPFAQYRRRSLPAVILLPLLATAGLQAANIPRKAPDFAIVLGDGKPTSLSQYQGKVVALLFILTTCPHCQAAVRCLTEDQNEFGPRGFQALASAIEDKAKADLPGFVRQFNPPFPVGYNKSLPALDFMQHPPIVGPRMPMIAFIDRQGIVRAQYEGQESFLAQDQMGKNIRAKIVELLGEGAPGVRKKPKQEGRPGGPPH
jgi:thiol-disulfide isomerase/thioredoxin